MENYILKLNSIPIVYFRVCSTKWSIHFKIREFLTYSFLYSLSLPCFFFSLLQYTTLCLTNKDTILWPRTPFYTMLLFVGRGCQDYLRQFSSSNNNNRQGTELTLDQSCWAYSSKWGGCIEWEPVGSNQLPHLICCLTDLRVVPKYNNKLSCFYYSIVFLFFLGHSFVRSGML